jgi:RNA polymerase sigma factor (sigma-70 family)
MMKEQLQLEHHGKRPMDDAAALDRFVRESSGEAFRVLVERYTGLVYATCLRGLGGDHNAAEEAVQSVFVILARKAGNIRPRALSTWLFQTANWVVVSARRKAACRDRHETQAVLQKEGARKMAEESIGRAFEPEEKALLNDAIAALRTKQQDAIVMHYLHGRSRKEVAVALGCSEDAVRKRIGYGLKKLRSHFTRKGIVLSVGALAAGLTAEGMTSVPAGLGALCCAAGRGAASIYVSTIAKGALKMMFWVKVKSAAIIVTTASVVVGVGTVGVLAAQENDLAAKNTAKYEWQENWGERAAWSRRMVRVNKSGFFETCDLPEASKLKVRSWKLERLDKPGEFVDPGKDFAGKVVLVSLISPKQAKCWKDVKGQPSQALHNYRRLHKEFENTDTVIIAVWQESGEDQAKKRLNAEAYFKANPVPGIVLLDDSQGRGKGFLTFSAGCSYGSHEATSSVLKGKNGVILFRGYYKEYPFDAFKLMIKRALDPAYAAQSLKEFPAVSRYLPIDETVKDALVYRDDFESYADTFALRTAARWGFHYETQHRMDLHAGLLLEPAEGDSKAAVIKGNPKWYHYTSIEHDLPVPLRNGVFRFRLKPIALGGKSSKDANTPEIVHQYDSLAQTSLIVTFRQPDSIAPSGYLLLKGGRFLTATDTPFIRDISEKGPVEATLNTWYEIEVLSTAGKKSEVFLNGKSVGTLAAESLMGVTFRCSPKSKFLLDDVEARYPGNPVELQQQHTAYVQASCSVQVGTPADPNTEEQKKKFVFDNVGANARDFKSSELAPHYHDPLTPNGDLVMEKAYKPGEYVNMSDHRGEVIFMHGTADRSPLMALKNVFNGSHQAVGVRRKFYDDYHKKAQIYDFARGYGMTTRSGYEEYREFYHELLVAKRAALKILGGGHANEICETLDEDHYLMRSVTEPHSAEWGRLKALKLWGGGHGSLPTELRGFILNKDGNILYRTCGEYPYHEGGDLSMRAALDDDFRKSVINDFQVGSPIVRSRSFPNVQKKPNGVLYTEDFESYKEDTDLRTAPCWGFRYKDIRRAGGGGQGLKRYMSARNELAPGKGKDGSMAMLVDTSYLFDRVAQDWDYQGSRKVRGDCFFDYKGQVAMKHTFPEELKFGYFKCSLRQGPKTKRPEWGSWEKLDRNIWFMMNIYGPDKKKVDAIVTNGRPTTDATLCFQTTKGEKASIAVEKWTEDKFNGKFPEDKTWHELRIVARNGKNVEVFVDGKSIGQLSTKSISAISIRGRAGDGMYVDDVELFIEE